MTIKIKYDGRYPYLCSGKLTIITEEKIFILDDELTSGGTFGFKKGKPYFKGEYVTKGNWKINKWPNDFPEEIKDDVLEIINKTIPHGCCGGCL